MALLEQELHGLSIQPLIPIDDYLKIMFAPLEPHERTFQVPLSKQNDRRQWYVNKALRIYNYSGETRYKVVEYLEDNDSSQSVSYSDRLKLKRKSAHQYRFSGVSLHDGRELKIYITVSEVGCVSCKWKRQGYNPSYFHVRSPDVQRILERRG